MKAAPISMRWTMDMQANADSIAERPLGPVPGDVPRVDDRRIGLPYRYAYLGQVDPTRPMVKAGPVGGGFNMIGQLDTHTGQNNGWFGADTDGFEEPQFIPTGPNDDDGYVVAIIERHDRNLSDVGVWDAKRFADGPIAIARVPFRLRLAFHGCWVPAEARG
jgi:carotenoid cleavage dioxygenase